MIYNLHRTLLGKKPYIVALFSMKLISLEKVNSKEVQTVKKPMFFPRCVMAFSIFNIYVLLVQKKHLISSTIVIPYKASCRMTHHKHALAC